MVDEGLDPANVFRAPDDSTDDPQQHQQQTQRQQPARQRSVRTGHANRQRHHRRHCAARGARHGQLADPPFPQARAGERRHDWARPCREQGDRHQQSAPHTGHSQRGADTGCQHEGPGECEQHVVTGAPAKAPHVDLETPQEKQERQPEHRQRADHVIGVHPAQDRGPDDDTGDDLHECTGYRNPGHQPQQQRDHRGNREHDHQVLRHVSPTPRRRGTDSHRSPVA